MKSQNKIIIVAILTIAFFTLIKVNDEIRAAQPDKPTCIGPQNEEVLPADISATFASTYSCPDCETIEYYAEWAVTRYDSESEVVYETVYVYDSNTIATFKPVDKGLVSGLKYKWQVRHYDYFAQDPPSEWSDECTFKVGYTMPETMPTIAGGSSLSDFDMFSTVHWPENPNPEEEYDITYDPQEHRIGTWDPEKNKYIEFGQGLIIEPGRAYWVLSRDPLELSFEGVPVSTTEYMEVCLHTHPSTKMGWNMIAPPNKANYLWNEVMVGRFTDDVDPIIVDPVPVTSPTASTLINHRIYEWQNGDYVDHKLDEYFVLKYYKGYWVKAIVDGVYLVFPAPVQPGGLSAPKNIMLAWKGKAIRWMKRLLPTPREAIADNDLPPMPMESFDGGANPLFEGCFVQTLR